MQNINGKMYVKGYLEISFKAVKRLEEIGVDLKKCKEKELFDSFFFPLGNFHEEFHHKPGNVRYPGLLTLKGE